MVSSFLFYILDTESPFFLILILFFLLHLFFYILYTVPLSSLLYFLLSLFSSMLSGTDHTICFSLVSQEGILVLGFHGFEPLCLYISYSPHTLLLLLLLTILSQAEVHLLEVCSSPHNIPVLFPIWNIPASSLAVSFVVWPHVLPLFFFFSLSLLQCLDTSIYSALSSNTKNTSLFPLFFPAFIPWPLLLFYTSSLDLLIL